MFSRDVAHVVLALCETIDSPRSLTVALLLRNNELEQLLSLRCEARWYSSPDDFAYDNLVTDILRKCKLPGNRARLKANAIETYYKVERENHRTNLRLRDLSDEISTGVSLNFDHQIHDFVARARKFLSRVLGDIPSELRGRFGPGSVFESKSGSHSDVPAKIESLSPTGTEGAIYISRFGGDRFLQGIVRPTQVRGNRFTTVPKDATKDRGIAIEPALNIYLQLPIGDWLKSRIRQVTSIDLAGTPDKGTGQYLHRNLLRDDSTSWSTIDLSNASDTVTTELVRLLLPGEWYDLLDALRCRFTLLKGTWHRNEKFSSMGNGFTFELETLIFMSIGYALGLNPGRDLYVYGDDILLPPSFFSQMCTVLRFFGFTPNPSKSFHLGRFKESCGYDSFDGQPVRAYYLKDEPNGPEDWIAFANGLNRFCTDRGFDHICASPFRSVWFRLLGNIPSAIRQCRGPSWLGDQVIHDLPPHWTTKKRNCMLYVRAYRPVFRSLVFTDYRPDVQLLSALYNCWESPRGVPTLAPRSGVKGYKRVWAPVGI